ncbi:ROK family transcriptional regulator [Streptomyces sp. NPDC050625]|uniref:ROK family transcriptional regulator n=1 Tax=Streptomyces sp. NPDC050625 TaxID=3154629 RepID=UPI00343BD0AA
MKPVVKRTTSDLRLRNRSTLLSCLYVQGPTSRNALTRASGLSSATVSNVVSQLIAEGLIAEGGSEDSDGGRPRSVLEICSDYGTVIGVDIGETHIRIGLFDWTLSVITSEVRSIADIRLDAEAVAELVLQGVSEVTRAAGVDPADLLGVGVGVPGAVRPDPRIPGRMLVHAPTLGWAGVPLGEMLARGVEAPLMVDNCARTLGQAEMWRGVGRGVDRVVTALIGVGVGAALAPGTEGGVAGLTPATIEWGHTVIYAGGLPCRCGSQGCLEAYVGAEAILHRYQATLGSQPFHASGTEGRLAELTARAATDPVAMETLEGVGEYIGIGIGNLINLLHPDLVVLSGWAGSVMGGVVLPTVRETAERHALSYLRGHTEIEVGRLGHEAVAMGAATLPVSHLLATGGRPRAVVSGAGAWG